MRPAADIEQADWEQTKPPTEIADRPRIATVDVPICPVCGDRDFLTVTVAFDYESATCSNPWRFVECAGCGHVRLHPRPADDTLPVIYPPSYYSYDYARRIHSVARRGKEWLDERKLHRILSARDEPVTTALDVGCGEGRMLRALARLGVPKEGIAGTELDPKILAPLEAAGYAVFPGRVEEIAAIGPGSLDLITMFHVLEHVADPAAVVRKLSQWLRPGGLLALETPNWKSPDARLFRDRWWGGYHVPRHWQLFSPSTLVRLLTGAGLEVRTIRYQTGHSFWLFSFHHWLKYGLGWRRLAQAFDPYRSFPVLLAFTGLDIVRGALGRRTSAMLVLAQKPAR